MADIGRRGFVKGATLGALAFTVGGTVVLMAPGEARARNVPFRLLDAHQGDTIEAIGETLVPQAREATVEVRKPGALEYAEYVSITEVYTK